MIIITKITSYFSLSSTRPNLTPDDVMRRVDCWISAIWFGLGHVTMASAKQLKQNFGSMTCFELRFEISFSHTATGGRSEEVNFWQYESKCCCIAKTSTSFTSVSHSTRRSSVQAKTQAKSLGPRLGPHISVLGPSQSKARAEPPYIFLAVKRLFWNFMFIFVIKLKLEVEFLTH